MRRLCSRIVVGIGDWWTLLGWVLFVGWLVIPWLVLHTGAFLWAWAGLGVLVLLWWAIDIADQQVALWKILIGVVMLAIAYITPLFGAKLFLTIAAWALYWAAVRE